MHVSVPLSGLTSVNKVGDLKSEYRNSRFRPLIGVNFCKLSDEVMDLHYQNLVSVPLSGLTSVNYNIR